jgi:hypothetical protein
MGQSRRGTQFTFGKLEDCLLPNCERGIISVNGFGGSGMNKIIYGGR